jgi:DNA repair protein RadD
MPAEVACFDCGTPFPVLERKPDATKYSTNSDDEADPLYTTPPAPPQWVDVLDVTYKRHAKPGKPPTLWVKYLTEFEEYSEWVCFEHEGYALQKAHNWWLDRARARPMLHTVAEAANIAHTLPKPCTIQEELNLDRIELDVGDPLARSAPQALHPECRLRTCARARESGETSGRKLCNQHPYRAE